MLPLAATLAAEIAHQVRRVPPEPAALEQWKDGELQRIAARPAVENLFSALP